MRAYQSFRVLRAGLLALSLLGGLTACTGKEPVIQGDPIGVDREAKPQIIIKDQDATIDGHFIKYRVTSYTEAKEKLGEVVNNIPGDPSAAIRDRFGYIVFASEVPNPNDVTYPVVSVIEVWLRQEISYRKFLPCDEAGLVRHRRAQASSIQSWRNEAKTHGLAEEKLAQEIAKVQSEPCSMAGQFPENTFKGYLSGPGRISAKKQTSATGWS